MQTVTRMVRFMRDHCKNWFSGRKLKEKINILFIAVFLTFAALILTLYQFIIRSNFKNYAVQNNKDTLVSIGSNLQAKIDATNILSKQIMIDSIILDYLNAPDGQDILLSAAANRTVDEFFSVTVEINSIYVFRLDGDYIKISNGTTVFREEAFRQEALQQKIFEGEGSYLLCFNGDGAFKGKKGTNSLTFYRLINDISSQKPTGILAVNLDMDILYNCIKDFSNDIKGFCFIDENGEILLQDNWKEKHHEIAVENSVYGHTSESRIFSEAVTSYYKIPGTNITVLSYETIGLFSMVTKELLVMLVSIIIFVMAVFSVLGYAVNHYVTRPVEKLVASMDEVKTGKFHRVSIRLPNDEIGRLKDSYNQMLVELNRLVAELIDKEKDIQKAELTILQEQIKPHFLYNTIDMIGNLALEENAEGVFDALETLGDFYRKFLSKGSRDVTIGEEVEIVRNYLKLQKLRYGDIFEDVYEIDKRLLDVKVPKLILQPLVENSLYHGIRMKGEKGVIRIKVWEEALLIHISVYDTGVGMPQEIISQILNSHEFRSFGVKGTMERIRYYYDSKCEIHISSEESRYTEIRISIPGTAEHKQTVSDDRTAETDVFTNRK